MRTKKANQTSSAYEIIQSRTVADCYLTKHQRKFAPMFLFPYRLHVSDASQAPSEE